MTLPSYPLYITINSTEKDFKGKEQKENNQVVDLQLRCLCLTSSYAEAEAEAEAEAIALSDASDSIK